MTETVVIEDYRFPVVKGNEHRLILMSAVGALTVQALFKWNFVWFVLFSSLFVFLFIYTYTRKLLADYAHVHYGGYKIEWKRPEILIKIVNITTWIDWFDIPSLGHLPVPLNLVYKPLPWERRPDNNRFQARIPLERWEEKIRLILTCIGEIDISIRMPKAGQKLMKICVQDVRQHMPQETAQISSEQRILFPDGYPNLIEPLYRWWMRIGAFGGHVLAKNLGRLVEVSIKKVEMHNLPNPASLTFVLNEEDPQSVSPLHRILNESAESLKQPEYNTVRNDKDTLTVLINEVQLELPVTEDYMTVKAYGISVYEGRNYTLHTSSNGNMNNSAVAAVVNGAILQISLSDFERKLPLEYKPSRHTVVLAQDKVLSRRLLSVKVSVESIPPYSVNSKYMDTLISTTKTVFIRKFQRDSESQSIMKSSIPIIGRLWEGSGMSYLTRHALSETVSSLAKRSGPVSVSGHINLMW
ncbi:hypothetical protein MP228_007850 [Amoeboaphelidium protococcarum]|nr:hypothetical protein MP228_007850 [Amoeboaphelidium protococcarum]